MQGSSFWPETPKEWLPVRAISVDILDHAWYFRVCVNEQLTIEHIDIPLVSAIMKPSTTGGTPLPNRSIVCTIASAVAVTAVLVAGLSGNMPPRAHADSPNDWTAFHYDAARTGYNPNEPGLKPPLRLRWSFSTGGYISSSPVVADGTVYVVASYGQFHST